MRMPTSAKGKTLNPTPWVRRLGMFDVANTEIASTCLFMREVSSTFACSPTRATLPGSAPESVRTWSMKGTSDDGGVRKHEESHRRIVSIDADHPGVEALRRSHQNGGRGDDAGLHLALRDGLNGCGRAEP